jgi:hypothetical protein
MDLLKGLVAQRLGEIDTKDLRADAGRELAHLDRLVAHWLFLTFAASLREKETMSDSLILRAATAVDAPTVAAIIAAAVEDEARRRELAGVRLGVRIVLTENQRLFTSLGYVEISREAHEGFDHPTSINMRKALR